MDQTNGSQLATKKDLLDLEERLEKRMDKRFATKTDLKNVKSALWTQSLRLEERMENVEGRLENVEGRLENVESKIDILSVKMDNMMNTLVGFVGRVDELTTEVQVGTQQMRDVQEKIDNHEERIVALEKPHTITQ